MKPPQALAPPPDAAAGSGRTTTRRQHHQHVKVKHIVTTEVSTDEASFKDLVQSLTGKDSGAARAAAVAAADGTSRRSNNAFPATGTGVINNDAVGGVLPSSEEMMKWFWPDA